MVHSKTRQHSPIVRRLQIFGVILTATAIALGVIIGVNTKHVRSPEFKTPKTSTKEVTTPSNTTNYLEIDFQSIVDKWASSISGNKSVIIFDIENDKIVGEYNPDDIYDTASLYKLFVAYEGYRRLENQTMQPNAMVGSTGYNVLECLDFMIRESNSECAETIMREIGTTNLEQIIANDYHISNVDLSNLISTPRSILEIMKLFYYHPEIKNKVYLAQIYDSFLNQPTTIYNWRQGLPAGFKTAKVYNKVGWNYNPAGFWNMYHDTAIIDFPEQNRHYIVVVMTNYVPFEIITQFGNLIEETVLSKY